jgi:CheY-like chemotaxis protein
LYVERATALPEYVRTDEVKLRQVLINLLNNAIKFTKQGTVELRIANCELRNEQSETINPKSEIRNLQFEISDTGYGIAPEELKHLFGAFVQTEAGRRAHEGTGLGLAISQRFVQLMGGDLTVQSQLGEGTTFGFTIQVVAVPVSEAVKQSNRDSRRPVVLEPDQRCYRLLVVDDNAIHRELLMDLLTPLGFDIREAVDGSEAIRLWRQWQPHLIWLDRRLPKMDGYDVTRTIRQAEQSGNVPRDPARTVIIIVSASAMYGNPGQEYSADIDDMLGKPFKLHDIIRLLYKHLGVRFVYEEEEKQAQGAWQERNEALAPEALEVLPEPLYLKLQNAVEAIDFSELPALLDEIRDIDAVLAEKLQQQVDDYRFDLLQTLCCSSSPANPESEAHGSNP